VTPEAMWKPAANLFEWLIQSLTAVETFFYKSVKALCGITTKE
jgi:hypothetical protein